MKLFNTLLVVPLLLFLTGCSTRYSAVAGHSSGYGYPHHRGHVSVGVSGRTHARGGDVLGALIVGGVIGHLLSEAARESREAEQLRHSATEVNSDEDELVKGYSINQTTTSTAQKNSEQNRFYQSGKDGNCYLMERIEDKVRVVAVVPKYSCG